MVFHDLFLEHAILHSMYEEQIIYTYVSLLKIQLRVMICSFLFLLYLRRMCPAVCHKIFIPVARILCLSRCLFRIPLPCYLTVKIQIQQELLL
jgi:hypothetical protein